MVMEMNFDLKYGYGIEWELHVNTEINLGLQNGYEFLFTVFIF